MTFVDTLVKNSYISLASHSDDIPPCGATRFRWGVHIALPFTIPSTGALQQKVTIEGREYEYSIQNFVDRLTIFPATQPVWPSVRLIGRLQPTPPPQIGWRHGRETLQSVACFLQTSEYPTPGVGFVDAGDKIKACFRFLSEHLVKLQSALPYLTTWQIYPISQFDIGLAYHAVEHFCPTKNRWDHFQTGIAINLARQLHQPLFQVSLPNGDVESTPVDLINELLAEAQVSLFRGVYRLAVINSYQAVESFANAIFKSKKIAKFINDGMAPDAAEDEAEKVRKKHRVDITFLLHHGLVEACDSSLFRDDKEKYDRLCELNKLRHKIAHAGLRPTHVEAEAAHLLCCEVVQWLCGIGGLPVRPLRPATHEVASGLVSLPTDINAIPGVANAFIRWVMGIEPNSDSFEGPCHFSFQANVQQQANPTNSDPLA